MTKTQPSKLMKVLSNCRCTVDTTAQFMLMSKHIDEITSQSSPHRDECII